MSLRTTKVCMHMFACPNVSDCYMALTHSRSSLIKASAHSIRSGRRSLGGLGGENAASKNDAPTSARNKLSFLNSFCIFGFSRLDEPWRPPMAAIATHSTRKMTSQVSHCTLQKKQKQQQQRKRGPNEEHWSSMISRLFEEHWSSMISRLFWKESFYHLSTNFVRQTTGWTPRAGRNLGTAIGRSSVA